MIQDGKNVVFINEDDFWPTARAVNISDGYPNYFGALANLTYAEITIKSVGGVFVAFLKNHRLRK